MSNGMHIDGIASNTAVDTAGEVVDLNGLDCSSLTGAALNWEHQNSTPNQIVGKILEFKKIFSEKDCENDRHKYYWEKCKMPFLYILGRLFDDKKDSAREAAALFLDDMQHPDEHPMVGFSIEGQKIEKKGMVITRSIARKTTITAAPANKLCIAQMVPSTDKKPKDDIDNIFKTESFFEIELIKSDKPKLKKDLGGGLSAGGASTSLSGGAPIGGGMTNSEKNTGGMNKSKPKLSVVNSPNSAKPHEKGYKIGRTSAGNDVWSHGPVNAYTHFGSDEHAEASNIHQKVSDASNHMKTKQHHNDKAKLHGAASRTLELKGRDRSERKQNLKKPLKRSEQVGENEIGTNIEKEKMHKADIKNPSVSTQWKGMDAGTYAKRRSEMGESHTGGKVRDKVAPRPRDAEKDLKQVQSRSMQSAPIMTKALDAGSMNAAPGQLQGGAVLAGGGVSRKMQKVTKKPKSKWLARAEEEYAKWEKREEFENFMAKRMPHMAKHEIQAIGKTLALSKSLRAEKILGQMDTQRAKAPNGSYMGKAENTQEHIPVHHDEFHSHLSNAMESNDKVKQYVHKYKPEEYSKMKTFLHPDKKSGFAVKPDGDIVSVFSTEKGRGDQIVNHAKKVGGTKLDAFDGYLPKLYSKHGFKETHREKNWNPGGPDVVYMKLHNKK